MTSSTKKKYFENIYKLYIFMLTIDIIKLGQLF